LLRYIELSNYKIAKNLYTKALNIKDLHYGSEHPQTAIALTNLGNIYMDLGNHEIAKDLYTKALNIKELHYGNEHPQTAIALTNLGNIYIYGFK
jgi:tetratricopeptide (TPR) repeat protein